MYHRGNELINPVYVLTRVGIQPGWHVADLGCGSLGHFVFPAAKIVGSDGRVYAVDVQKIMLDAIERTARYEQFWNVHPVWSDLEVLQATPIPPNSLDLTIVANNLYLSRQREMFVAEAARLTKPGGIILVIDWKREPTVLGPPQEHRLSREDAQSYFPESRFLFADTFDAGDCHYALVYRRSPDDASDASLCGSVSDSSILN